MKTESSALGFTLKLPGRKWIVICGNYQEFNVFCDIQLKNYKDGSNYFEGDEFIYYSSPESILGLRDFHIIGYGTYKNRNDVDYDYLKICVNYKE
jgi:hypothetical protein